MNPSKGPRRLLRLRLPVAIVASLELERDRRHADDSLRRVDGLPAIIEEVLALRIDRDAEMDRLRSALAAAQAEAVASRQVAAEAQREVRRGRDGRRREVARGVARALSSRAGQACSCGVALDPHAVAAGDVLCATCRSRRVAVLEGREVARD